MEFDFDLENPFPTSNDGNFPLVLFHIESDHMPSKTYLQTLCAPRSNLFFIRRQIISFILHFSRNFDAFSSYLAINYADRFLSTSTILIQDSKPWILKLVAISCCSLALKMRKTEFSVSEFRGDCTVILDSVTVERMEMLILGTLKWRMRSVSPFSFLSYFISFFQFKEEEASTRALKDRATQLVLTAQNDVKLLEFKPSLISAAALLCAAHQLFPAQLTCFRNSISSCRYVNKENLINCYNVMQVVAAMDGYESVVLEMASSTCTAPASVLDLQCFSSSTSFKKQRSKTTNDEIRGLKRRKFGDLLIGNDI